MTARYIAATWPAHDAEARQAVLQLAERLEAEPGWTRLAASGRWTIWSTPDAKLHVLPRDGGFVVGDLFQETPLAEADDVAGNGEPLPIARNVVARSWGRYVAFLESKGGPPVGVLRDPSGQVGALTWRWADNVELVASDLAMLPSWLLPRRLSLNWDRIGRFLAAPVPTIHAPLFDDVEAVLPGEMMEFGRSHRRHSVWRPAAYVHGSVRDEREDAEELVRRVDRSTLSLTQPFGRLIVELSGGLDSAILAGSLDALQLSSRVVQWLNSYADRPEGDERAYASAVTDRLGVPLTGAAKSLDPLTEDGLSELASATWPAINGCDAWRDRDEVARLDATGAGAILSGQGGDAMFFQMPTALVFTDLWRACGVRALASPILPDLARRLRTSVWSVLAANLRYHRAPRPPAAHLSYLSPADVRAQTVEARHPWVADAFAQGLSPAKQIQIAALADAQLLHGDSRRRRKADILYPLLSQPVVEWCLGIPSPRLAGGAFDRPFARAAFARRLPEAIVNRRSKGDLNAYHSRLVARSLPMLRPYLLDGCLCAGGALDRATLETVLDPNQLIWRAAATEIFWAATTESWARHWQTRIPDSDRAPRRRA